VGTGGTILRTTDGGSNWFNQASGTTIDLNSVSFTSSNNGTAVGGINADSGIVLHTTNGGTTWVRQTIPTSLSLWGVSFIDDNNGAVVGYYQPKGTILHTTDGGLNWANQSAGSGTDWLRAVHFVNSRVGMAVGLFTTVIRTTDGGATWVNLYPVFRSQHYDGVFLSDTNTVTVVGYGGEISRTIDGGTNWTTQNSNTSASLIDVYFTDLLNGTIVGTNGTILHTTTGGITRLQEYKNLPSDIVLFPNYPNPFNPITNITFRLPFQTYATLKVLDLLGREVVTLVSEKLSAGIYTRQWNASGMPSGIYFYELHVGSYTEKKKLLLLQ
jgi:photosystem II stability/assembly factor-like uncharacterized protein